MHFFMFFVYFLLALDFYFVYIYHMYMYIYIYICLYSKYMSEYNIILFRYISSFVFLGKLARPFVVFVLVFLVLRILRSFPLLLKY